MIFSSFIGSNFFRYFALSLSALYMILVALFMGAKLPEVGLQRKYFKEALSFIAWPTLFIALAIVLARIFFPAAFIKQPGSFSAPVWYILLSVPLQEILFRGFCLWRCKLTWKNTLFIILFNSFLFAMYHMVTNNWYLTIGVFLINIFWSYSFIKYPNLWAFMLSHAFLGTLYFLPVQ